MPALKRTIAIAAASLLAAFSAADACMSLDDHSAYIHEALPSPLPRGAFIAEVEFAALPERQDNDDLLVQIGLRARVLRVVQGDYGGRYLLARPTHLTSCDHIFGNGRKGLIVAIPRGLENGTLVVDPIAVDSAEGYRLPDGYQLDAERAALGALPRHEKQKQSQGFVPDRYVLAAVAAGSVGLVVVCAMLLRRRRRRSDASR